MKRKANKRKKTRKLPVIPIIVIVCLLTAGAGGYAVFQKVETQYPWLWMYLGDQFRPDASHQTEAAQHILFTFVDHFEPHDQETVSRWVEAYPLMADKHSDADGIRPQHTWFWYFDESDEAETKSFLRQLSQLAYSGYGEVELHMHHHHDTEESFVKLMNQAVSLTQETGGMITAESKPQTAFGFIHGLWSLDNSRGEGACGVNNELILLRKLGCYADFTHPSWGPMHPRMVNRLYYATDDPHEPKSDATGVPMKVGKPGLGDLLIFEGPSVVRFNGLRPVYDHGDVTMTDLPTPERIDAWVRTGVQVEGRPEWIFVKVFTHSAIAEDHEAVLGEWRDKMHTYFEENYNDGENYVLHYVSAREAYNIAKAAEAGKTGNPNDYRDFLISPYVNRFLISDQPFETISFGDGKAVVRFRENAASTAKLRLRGKDVKISGDANVSSLAALEKESVLTLQLSGERVVGLSFLPLDRGEPS